MQKIRKAIIPAAGFGTRFLPETKAMPKEMLPIVDKPTIQYIPAESTGYGGETQNGRSPQPFCGSGAVCDYPGSVRDPGRDPAGERRGNPADRCPAGHGSYGACICVQLSGETV